MHDYDFFGEERMFESEDDLFDLDGIYQIPIEMVVHLRHKSEPIFTEHVFFFEQEDPVKSLDELMSFTSTWWNAINEDKNIKFIYFTDRSSNKKAFLADEIVAVSFMTPEKPDWMEDDREVDPDTD